MNASPGCTRRQFLRGAALAAVGTAANAPIAGAAPLPASRPPGAQAPPSFELDEATIGALQEGLRTGRYTARRLCELYLDRIAALDAQGPALRSVIEVNPDALAIAGRADQERRANRTRGPLHGIPVLIKDNIATADRMMTTAGSLALVGARAPRDAGIVSRLREAGAVILGKTNLSEWANFRSSHSVSGWSGRGGRCLNPYALDRSPCGSSSGSGAAIAANLAAVAVGTETDGSIVCPASATSLVGIKPTLGLLSAAGIVPIAHSQDTAGPMARTVTDAALLLGALAGVDYASALDPNGLRGARIGVARQHFFGYSHEADRLVEAALDVMRQAGAVIVDPADIPHAGEYDDSELTVLLYEFKADLSRYLADWAPGAPVASLADIVAFNERTADREMPYFGQDILLSAANKGPLTEPEYQAALAKNRRLSRDEGLDAVFAEQRLDAIVAPTGSPPWTTDLVNGDHFLGASSTPAAVAGYPSVSVPAGFAFGLPVGISFIGRERADAALIRLAYAFERAAAHRRPPRFLPTADLSAR